MAPDLFPTPEAAAMQGFPAAHCRVLAVELDGKDGFVVLDTGPAEYRYLYGGTVERVEGGWTGGIDGNGGAAGWTLTDREREVGVVALWDEAPAGADAVRVTWRSARLRSAMACIWSRGGGSRTQRALGRGSLLSASTGGGCRQAMHETLYRSASYAAAER